MMVRIAILGLLLFDTSGKRDLPIRPENLGRQWTAGAPGEDAGLRVQAYFNHQVNRDEAWHQTAEGEWFIRIRPGLYVNARAGADGNWTTRPSERLVLRGGRWTRLRVP